MYIFIIFMTNILAEDAENQKARPWCKCGLLRNDGVYENCEKKMIKKYGGDQTHCYLPYV